MKFIKLLAILGIMFTGTFTEVAAQENNVRSAENLHSGWKFYLGSQDNAKATDYDDSLWREVTVPHDWAIESDFIDGVNGYTGKLPWRGEGWYRRALDIPTDYDNKSVYLLFDGVMAFPKVYVNGVMAGEWDYGYNSFYLDITDLVIPGGDNQLAVHANTTEHDSRWYPGAGIYRKVQLLVMEPVHVGVWGTYITTPEIKPNYADVRIRNTIINQSAEIQTVHIEQNIFNAMGNLVAQGEHSAEIKAGNEKDMELNLVLSNPIRWDIDNPHLYTARTLVYVDGVLSDSLETDFGVRSIRFSADNGFYLNDRRVQLQGVNLHHDHGPLGAAFYPRAMERQLEIMKAMGVNAVRNSHNTAAPEFLELADRMGMLVFNEVFDKYDAKADILEETDFDDFAQRNIHNFVVRDRNHPSVFIWSVGNEIKDVQWNEDNGFQRLQTMLNYVERYDATRPTTLVNDSMDSAVLRHFEFYDIHSWNYTRRYRLARQLEPNKSVIISESASTLSTRGFYEFPLPEDGTIFSGSMQLSSYDLNYPSWAEVADDDFMWQQNEPYVAGEFVWTGFDYLGEPTPYGNVDSPALDLPEDAEASRSSYFGIVDLVGIPKDRYYLYKSYWNQQETTVHILPHWNWDGREGETVPVFVYTNGDCAELFINDITQGMKCKDPKSEESTERFRLMWIDTTYEPGEVRVVAYKEGLVIGEQSRRTAGDITRVKLSADRSVLSADGMDLAYVLVEAYDEQGNPQPLSANRVDISIEGPGVIRGVGNGNPQSFEPMQSSYVDLFYGKAMIIVGSQYEEGVISINVDVEGLDSEFIHLESH